VKSSLAGVVLEDRLVAVGEQVEDAQPLVYVRTTLTGTIGVAARAPRDGTIREVLVRPGQRIRHGELVVRLQPR
jgi:biotin carboxyl carrier protein